MRDVAREMNLSETAFLVPTGRMATICAGSRPPSRSISAATPPWPAPTSSGRTAICREGVQARFHTRSGLLTGRPARRLDRARFPRQDRGRGRCPRRNCCPRSASPQAKFVGKNAFDYLVEIDSEDELARTLARTIRALRKLPVRGVIVTARSSAREYDFVSRFFAPGSGIDEDPVTGSAHTALGPYWAQQPRQDASSRRFRLRRAAASCGSA